MTLYHLELQLTDVDHKIFPLQFNTASRGNKMQSANNCKGYTVAVLFAKHHAFMYSNPSVDHVDP
jgi:hypothetical protein